jgi:hypothetical protein
MRASQLAFRAGILFAVAGLTMGIVMAASHNHATAPAHAHINLMGWVSLFLIGFFYEKREIIDGSRPAFWQVVSWIAGALLANIGVTVLTLGHVQFEPVAAVGSFIVLASALLFAGLVFKGTRA